MIAAGAWLVAASAAILFGLGSIHLYYTFHGRKLYPREAVLQARMQEVSPVLSTQTSMWKSWLGFNASHSFGAIFFGLVYGYLSLAHGALLFQSWFLSLAGLALLAGYVILAKLYWFSIPYRGIVLATALYIAALVVART